MILPSWINDIITAFDAKTEPHSETDVAQALEAARANQNEFGEQDDKVYLAEHSVFLLRWVNGQSVSIWGTYFGPCAVIESTGFISPDISQLDAETVAHWEQRANETQSPVIKARYADAAWDLGKMLAQKKPDYRMALLAIDAYTAAADQRLSTMPFGAVQWLARAFDLARKLQNKPRTNQVIASMFSLYESCLSPQYVGIWLTLIEHLYEARELLKDEQIARMVADMEKMLTTLSTPDENKRFDAFNAQSVGEKLILHYKNTDEKDSVIRVLKTFGGAFERMADNSGAMLASGYLQPIIERYEQEGLKSEAEELQNKALDRMKNAADEMKTISIPHQITSEEVEGILNTLIVENDLAMTLNHVAFYFTPKIEEAKNLIEQTKAVAPFMSMIPVSIADESGRTIGWIGDAEDDEGRLYYQLAQTMTFTQPYLYIVLSKIKERFSFSVDDLMAFLYECPIFPTSRRPLLREGLSAYLNGDFLKAIHVLIPQVEESLRNFLALIGIPPVKNVLRHPGITDVKSMNNVLEDARVREKLPEYVWRYLTVLYVERIGFNLRNNLAHGLMPLEAFNEVMANWVFHSLLILSPIRMTSQNAS
jgi:hypothetical protein